MVYAEHSGRGTGNRTTGQGDACGRVGSSRRAAEGECAVGGFARADQIDVLVITQGIRPVDDQQSLAHARHKFVYGFRRIDCRQGGVLQLLQGGSQVSGHAHFFPSLTICTALRAASAGVAYPVITSSIALRSAGPVKLSTLSAGMGWA